MFTIKIFELDLLTKIHAQYKITFQPQSYKSPSSLHNMVTIFVAIARVRDTSHGLMQYTIFNMMRMDNNQTT